MRLPAALFAMIASFAVTPVAAQEIVYEFVEVTAPRVDGSGERFLGDAIAVPEAQVPAAAIPTGIARFGPFRVIDGNRAALVDVTTTGTPAAFAAMLKAYPGISQIDMVECPGTEDDLANLRLGRMIREKGMTTRVPRGGSVRSGAVELFLAGARRYADPGSEFAVHSWMDDTGHEATDYDASDPANARYIAYYKQMGMSAIEANAFYAMTNSVPFESARWLGANEMALWVRLDGNPVG